MMIPATIFENMGFTYLGPVDGHNTEQLISLLQRAKLLNRPVVIHAITQKGKGYKPAEADPSRFHGIGKFDPESGEQKAPGAQTFSSAFGEEMVSIAKDEPRLCAITAAMPSGTGLLKFGKEHPDRFFDVGIAEEHAVSMAGGLAKQGMLPVVALYSTFLQRSYDMILQDICMLKLHTVFAVDRAGLVGEDGQTHHGVFDVGFLSQAPAMTVLCPASCRELKEMLSWAVLKHDGPVALRYGRGGDRDYSDSAWNAQGSWICRHREGKDVTIVTYGTLLKNAIDAAELLEQKGVSVGVVRLMAVKPLPAEELARILPDGKPVVILEECCSGSGIGFALAYQLQTLKPGCRVHIRDLGPDFVTHGSVERLYRHCGLDARSLVSFIQEVRSNEN